MKSLGFRKRHQSPLLLLLLHKWQVRSSLCQAFTAKGFSLVFPSVSWLPHCRHENFSWQVAVTLWSLRSNDWHWISKSIGEVVGVMVLLLTSTGWLQRNLEWLNGIILHVLDTVCDCRRRFLSFFVFFPVNSEVMQGTLGNSEEESAMWSNLANSCSTPYSCWQTGAFLVRDFIKRNGWNTIPKRKDQLIQRRCLAN